MFNPLSALGSAVSNAVESTLDAVLPKQLEFIGDLAGLAVDIRSGNVLKCIEDLHDLFQDLPQQLSELAQKKGPRKSVADGDSVVSAHLEPTPPPPYGASLESGSANATETEGTAGTAGKIALSTPELPGPGPRAGFGPQPHVMAGPVSRGSSEVAEKDQAATSSGQTTRATAKKTPAEPAKKSPLAGDAVGAAKPATDSKSASAKAATSSEAVAKGASVKDANAFFAQSDAALMTALRNGDLPKSVSESPAQMQRLQVRMNEITQMNHLITMMLTAMHDMNKQVIQNLRV